MRVLFLDDSPERRQRAQRELIGHVVFMAQDAPEAIHWLDTAERFDLAMLDHDLGGRVYTHDEPIPGPEGNGQLVANHIAAMLPENRPSVVVVHSFNPIGAGRMVDTLVYSGYLRMANVFQWPWMQAGMLYPSKLVKSWLERVSSYSSSS